jgi:DNA-directed RNA polymerase specialized sigma24 family protein
MPPASSSCASCDVITRAAPLQRRCEQMSIREIARRTGLSRNTVKKYLRAGEEMLRYAKRESSSKLDPYAEKLAT